MLGSQVKEFIQSLVSIREPADDKDLKFLNELKERFTKGLADESLLNENELNWLENLFAARWKEVADKDNDYTFNIGGINAHWISFAKELATELQKPYLVILMPVLADSDPNNLTRLNKITDPRRIFLLNDNNWHRVFTFYQELKKTFGVLGIRDRNKSNLPRPLTLNELNRLRSKKGEDLAFTRKTGDLYSSLWDYIKRVIAPTWHTNGANSEYLLPYLFEIIEKYLEVTEQNKNIQDFQESFKFFIAYLANRPLAEVNHFLGIQINIKGTNYFLMEILLDCMQPHSQNLTEKLLNVAKWISSVNPALVSKNGSINEFCKDLPIGPNFNSSYLRELILKLPIKSDSLCKSLQTEILNSIDANNDLPEIVTMIRSMYALRWDSIISNIDIDNRFDYTRLQKGINYPYIRLTQYLAGAGLIPPNYYRFLMPTLRHDYDPVTKELLTAYPLSKYILSTNLDELIFLENCMIHYQTWGTFSNCNYLEPMPLSQKERDRLVFADQSIYEFYLGIKEEDQDPEPISKRTIDEVRKLVNGSLNPSGLSNYQVSDPEYEIATKSYDEFLAYISELTLDEKNKLYRHRILLGSHRVSVQEIMDLIQSTKYEIRECIAGHGKFFAKLVLDYAPSTKFADHIEQEPKINTAKMRANSAKLIYSDYDGISEEEATKRILVIVISLFTHAFQYMWLTGTPISLSNFDNKVTGTGYEIFSLVQQRIEQGNFKEARFLYAQLMEHIIAPAIHDQSSWWKRYADTTTWLTSIQSNSIFNGENETYFEPELLLINLWSLAKLDSRFTEFIEIFLSELHAILLSDDNNYKKLLRVNIEFIKFLNKDDLIAHKTFIIKYIKYGEFIPINAEHAFEASKEFFIHRFAQLVSEASNYKISFFNNRSTMNYDWVKKTLNKKIEAFMIKENDLSLRDLFILLDHSIRSIERQDFIRSWEKLIKNIPEIKEISVITQEEKPTNLLSTLVSAIG